MGITYGTALAPATLTAMSDLYPPAATSPDAPRRVATSPDQYTLTIDDALIRYEHAGHPRTARSIQRYCAKEHLDCLRQETMFGDKFMITPESVARHISQIDELASASGRDMPRQVATKIDLSKHEESYENALRHGTMSPGDTPRHVATGRDLSEHAASPNIRTEVPQQTQTDSRYVAQLEIRLAEKDDVITMLRSQVNTKDQQIATMLDRDREVNTLMLGFQKLMGLLPQAKTEAPPAGEMQTDRPPRP